MPKYARIPASCSAVSAVDVPRRAAIASPGMSRMNANVSTETPSSVGIAPAMRCARYRLTRRPLARGRPSLPRSLLVQPGLPQVDDRPGREVDEALRRRKRRDVVAADVEPDERHAVHELLLRRRVEVLPLRDVGRRPRLLDGVARDGILVARDEV